MLNRYFEDIFKTYKTGDATEPSYYGDLKKLLESLGQAKNRNFHVTSLPKRTEAGNPDFRVWDGKAKVVGYIEAKDLSVQDLDIIEDSEQLKRYRSTFPNLILTNFFEFRLYRNGQLIEQVSVGRPFIIHQLKTIPPVENQEKFLKLLEQFFSFSVPTTTTAKSLAIELAKRTRFLRDNVIAEELKEEGIEGTQTLESFLRAFEEHLIPQLTKQDFANLFAQTITYGLFAARSRAKEDFNRELAYKYIPPTIGILKDVFRFISSTNLPQSMEWIIDDIAEVLANSNVQKIISDFYKEGKGRDPIIHFYETFLAEYDPKEREKRGVYYTPESVVSYITRSIHKLLKEKFDKTDGFADKSVTVLDPAAGTLTFPAYAIDLAISEFKEKYGEGGIQSLIKDHILQDFYAFELMMAPYAIGHLKIGLILDNLGYQFSDEERFNLYLTNTLDFSKEDPNKFPGIFEQTIAKESQEALKVKEDIPVMVIMGNPPYHGSSENKGDWISDQINEYKQIDGKPLGEKNTKWLQDDYVKFVRFAQWKIEQAGHGIIGFITNHAWLDNPTFRGMRTSLLKTFDEIYILNLHGSTLKKEKTPEGNKDENVFDIQPGVAITICVKHKEQQETKVLYSDLWGLREEKYGWLDCNDISTAKFSTINPIEPYYFFVPKENKGWDTYQTFWKISDIFQINSVGVVTGRDDFAIDEDRNALEVRVRQFADQNTDNELVKSLYRLNDKPASKWFLAEARKKIERDAEWEKDFKRISYRPFDTRWVFYNPALIERGRENVMRNLAKDNLAVVCCRQFTGDSFAHIFVTNQLVESCYVSNRTKEIGYVFPLFTYGYADNQGDLFEGSRDGVPNQNFAEEFKDFVYKDDLSGLLPQDIFYYIYAVLYSNFYRQKYQEFLKIDFPRIPFAKNLQLFQELTKLGQKLVDLHLLKAKELDSPIVKFKGSGDNLVEKVDYLALKMDEKPPLVGGCAWINEKQSFNGVNEFLWNYYIGGYQVLNKWLKDRKGRRLSSEEITTYCKIATAIHHTILIQKEIDKLYPEVEKSLINLKK